MQGARDLLASERGVFCIALFVASTVLAGMKIIPWGEWLTFVKWLGITLVASKTATGAIETLTNKAAT